MRNLFRQPRTILSLFLALFSLLWLGLESEVFARAGSGRSSGSGGYSSGGSSQRSPSQSPSPAPQQRDLQQQRQQQPIPPTGAGRSFLSGIAGGLIGGMLGGMLFRSLGFAGDSGWGSGGFGFGDILLILIILGIIYFVVKRFRSRETMPMSAAGAGATPYSYPLPPPGPPYAPSPSGEYAPEEFKGGELKSEGLRHIKEMDSTFSENGFKELAEDIFFKIQGGWSKRDLQGVRHLLSPEMFNIFQQDVNKLISEKQINRLENIAVREVEIIEAGQDRGEEFITVKFHANLLDYVVDEGNEKVLSGSLTDPVKFLEYWTFSRNVGGEKWVMAGITQERDY